MGVNVFQQILAAEAKEEVKQINSVVLAQFLFPQRQNLANRSTHACLFQAVDTTSACVRKAR